MARFVIVEDEFLVALDLQDQIESLGHDVIAIAPDSAALASVDVSTVDAALVDLHLRDGLTGPEIGAALAAANILVLFITANPALLGDGITGTVGVLTKPTDHEMVSSAIGFLLARMSGAETAAPAAIRLFGGR
jgi:two-component system, response regulator PdtaR